MKFVIWLLVWSLVWMTIIVWVIANNPCTWSKFAELCIQDKFIPKQ